MKTSKLRRGRHISEMPPRVAAQVHQAIRCPAGVFFVGVAWGAFHFWGDFIGYRTWQHAMIHIGSRIIGTVLLSYPFAWLTMKSRSILPAAIAHAVYNITVVGGVIFATTPWWLKTLLWAALGYAVFRFDPPEIEKVSAEVAPELTAENESGTGETAESAKEGMTA